MANLSSQTIKLAETAKRWCRRIQEKEKIGEKMLSLVSDTSKLKINYYWSFPDAVWNKMHFLMIKQI